MGSRYCAYFSKVSFKMIEVGIFKVNFPWSLNPFLFRYLYTNDYLKFWNINILIVIIKNPWFKLNMKILSPIILRSIFEIQFFMFAWTWNLNCLDWANKIIAQVQKLVNNSYASIWLKYPNETSKRATKYWNLSSYLIYIATLLPRYHTYCRISKFRNIYHTIIFIPKIWKFFCLILNHFSISFANHVNNWN